MRVLHVLGSIERSGAEIMLRDSIERFRAAGVETEILATGACIGGFASAFESLGVRLHHVPFAKSPGFFVGLYQIVGAGSYDVVHVHTERAALWIELTAKLCGVPMVVRSIHSCFQFTGWLASRRSAGRWVARRAMGVAHVFVSDSVADNEVRRFGTCGVCIPNGVDVDRFALVESSAMKFLRRRELGLPQDAIVLVSVGRCSDVKQHAHVLVALESLHHLVPPLHYLHVGNGPSCANEYSLAQELGLHSRCKFLGERDDMVSLLQASDVFVMPSAYEGLGLAALEASSCGLPIIAYDVPGLRDAVDNGRTGLLVESQPAAMAQAIAQFVGDAELRTAYGLAGRSRVKEQYNLGLWVERHIVLYKGTTST